MRIIIEGADGTGKSTIAKQLADEFDLGLMHLTNKDPRDLNFYYQLLRKNNVIYDRNFLAEMVYPSYFGRPPQLKEHELDYLIAQAKDLGINILILTADNETLTERLNQKNEYACVKENIEEINSEFLKYAGKYGLPVINTSKQSIEETLMEAKKCTRLQ